MFHPTPENAYAESFIGRLRDECLNQNWFLSLKEAIGIIESWRIDHNDGRLHSSLRGLSHSEHVENRGRTLTAVGLKWREGHLAYLSPIECIGRMLAKIRKSVLPIWSAATKH